MEPIIQKASQEALNDDHLVNIDKHFSSDDVKTKFKNKMPVLTAEYLDFICRVDGCNVYIDNRHFKYIGHLTNYDIILDHIVASLHKVLETFPLYTIHLCLKSLTVGQIEKHYQFIKHACDVLKKTFVNKLNVCYIYQAPFIFNQLFRLITPFLDKLTISKMRLYS